MTTKTISGVYASGYVLNSSYSYVTVTNTGAVDGLGLSLRTAGQSVTNSGTLSGDIGDKSAGLALNSDTGGIATNLGSISGYFGVNVTGVPVTLTNDASIYGSNFGVQLGKGGTVSNHGTILSSNEVGDVGVAFADGGSLINGSAVLRSVLIEGYAGVSTHGSTSSVVNFGTITSTNGGDAFDTQPGVYLGGGALQNGAGASRYDGLPIAADTTALIEGYDGVEAAAGGSVDNLGTILGTSGVDSFYAALFTDGGRLTNGSASDHVALINGYDGVMIRGAVGTVVNYGTVSLRGLVKQLGVSLAAGGLVTNGSASDDSATISGNYGVGIASQGEVVNFGTIEGLNTAGYGVKLAGGGTIVNGSAGDTAALIEGYQGVAVYSLGTLTNFGTIETTGKTAVSFNSSTEKLVVEAGSVFDGAVDGDGGTLDLGSGTGTISGLFAAGDVTVSGSMPTTTFDDFGTLEIASGATFTLAGNASIAAGQSLIDAGTLSVGKTLVIDGVLTSTGTLAGTGTLSVVNGTAAFDAGTSLTIANVTETGNATTATVGAPSLDYAGVWTQTGGTLSAASGDRENFKGTGNSFEGTLAGAGTIAFVAGSDTFTGAHLTGASLVINGATATLSGAIGLSGTLVASTDDLVIAGVGASLAGDGSLILSNLATNKVSGGTLTNINDFIKGAGDLGDGSMGLINDAGGIIDGDDTVALTIDTGSSTITNAGKIEATSTGTTTVTGAVDNTGVLAAIGGTLTLDQAVTGTGKAEIDGGTADFAGAFTQNVAFLGVGGGTLELAHSEAYTGEITGFSRTGTTALDLADIPFVSATTTASYSGTTTSGVLTVADGSHVARITLEGNYTTSKFTLSSDGHGGTKVVDPPAVSAQRFIAAAAAFGESGSAAHEPAETWRPSATPTLMAPALA